MPARGAPRRALRPRNLPALRLRRKPIRMRIACLLFLLPGVALAGDLVVREHTTIEGPQSKAFDVTQYYGDRKVVMDGPRQRTIVDIDRIALRRLFDQGKGVSL